jgi:hypothetical protein
MIFWIVVAVVVVALAVLTWRSNTRMQRLATAAIQAGPSDAQVAAVTGAPAEPSFDVAQAYDEATAGPAWRAVRGYATDPQAAQAVFRPEVLERTRELKMPWRMNGHAAMAIVQEWPQPQRMVEYLDALAEFASYIPEPVWQAAAAADPAPWPGPTPERPA